jgi:hypothetical protein
MHDLRLRVLAIVVPLLWQAALTSAQTTIYVDDDAPAGGDGSTWDAAFKYLQDALAAVGTNGTEIRVAQGFYRPDQDEGGQFTPGDRSASFQLINGVSLYGGYAGLTDPSSPDARNVQAYATTLSGDLAGDDGPTPFENGGDNSYHVVTGTNVGTDGVLDGFIVTGGNANAYSLPHSAGGGMCTSNGSPTLIHCTFDGNWAAQGGGMYNTDDSAPTVIECAFTENVAFLGGGMSNDASSPMVSGCIFTGNIGSSQGGGMSNSRSSTPTLVNCTFASNYGTYGGGGMYNTHDSDATLFNCALISNSAYGGGGAMQGFRARSTLANCTFIANTSEAGSGALSIISSNWTVNNSTFAANSSPRGRAVGCDSKQHQYPSSVQMVNCVLWDGGNEVLNDDGSTISITYSDVQGGWPGQGNVDGDPLFLDADGPDGVAGTEDDKLRLMPGSPCIDAGSSGLVPPDVLDLNTNGDTGEPNPFDGDGVPRIAWCQVDMGAYEYQGPFGDFYKDCDVDLEDYELFEVCLSFSGPAEGPPFEECLNVFDFDQDTDVDLSNYAVFQLAFTG